MSIPIELWKYISVYTKHNMIFTLQLLSKNHYDELSSNHFINLLLKSRYPVLKQCGKFSYNLNYSIMQLNNLECKYYQNILPIDHEISIKYFSFNYYNKLVKNSSEYEKQYNWVVKETMETRNNLLEKINNLEKIREIINSDFSQACLNLLSLTY